MEKILITIIDLIILLYFLLQIKVYIDIKYTRTADNDNIMLEVYALRKLLIYKLNIPVIEFNKHENFLWLESEVETDRGAVETHARREQNFLKKTFHIYLKYPYKIKQAIKMFKHYNKIYNSFKDELFLSMTCEKFNWKTVYGSQDAALTAIMTGGLWGLKSLVLNRLNRRIRLVSKPRINVIPIYNQQKFELDFKCIFSIRLGNVINATIKLFKA